MLPSTGGVVHPMSPAGIALGLKKKVSKFFDEIMYPIADPKLSLNISNIFMSFEWFADALMKPGNGLQDIPVDEMYQPLSYDGLTFAQQVEQVSTNARRVLLAVKTSYPEYDVNQIMKHHESIVFNSQELAQKIREAAARPSP